MGTAANIAAAVRELQAGEVVGFPTETVYGLGADATNPAAVANIFALKGRPPDHPLIVHIANAQALAYWAVDVPDNAYRLIEGFWPGPLTLILKRAPHVLEAITGGQQTVGLRCPAHPVATVLLEACGLVGIPGLAAPSANRFGHVSPTTAAHVRAEFGPALTLLDGGACTVGIESTIVDLSTDRPRILRPGMLGEAAIAAALQTNLSTAADNLPRVSGSLAAHYAPRTPLEMVAPEELSSRIQELIASGLRVVAISRTESLPANVLTIPMPAAAAAYAQRLYASLRDADSIEADRIVVEAPPQDIAWRAIDDRLQRAAVGSGDWESTAP
ncbi:MAG: threonylcarbamoyl-AMP synthase [Gammaproteobacteria bacterium]|nr:threonylcarbamoyl-AMP synthase [Gammaproteobacteria bacterium]